MYPCLSSTSNFNQFIIALIHVKPTTWIALFLLLITYFTLGWALSVAKLSLLNWGIIILGILLLVLFLTTPLEKLKGPIMSWFRSNVGTFIAVIFSAFLLVVLATWVDIFFRIFLMLSAMILARIELQTIGVKHWLAFLILMSLSLTGLALGWECHYLIVFGELPLF